MYRKMYLHLFNAVSDALQELDRQNLGVAKELLVQAWEGDMIAPMNEEREKS